MPDPPASTSVFGRRPSLFSGKKRKESKDISARETREAKDGKDGTGRGESAGAGTVIWENPETVTVTPPSASEDRDGELSPREEQYPAQYRDRQSSVVSIPTSVSEGNLHRSVSLISHDSRTSLSLHKSRAPSVANIASSSAHPAHSPVRLHRVSRSISANAVGTIHNKFGSFSAGAGPHPLDSITQSPHSRSRDTLNLTSSDQAHKSPFSMLATPFGHGVKRQDTGMTYASKPSISSDSGNPMAMTVPGGPSNPTSIYNSINEISNKRIATLDYLRKLHEGQIYYLNTMHYTPTNLSHMPSLLPTKISRRATGYYLLGTSIPPVLDIASGSPVEYLAALLAVLTEFDTFQNLENGSSGTRGRMGQMFKSGMRMRTGRRSSATSDSIHLPDADHNASTAALDTMPMPPSASYGYHHHPEFAYLRTPSLPFEPDFAVSFASLTDILIDTYDNLMQLIPGPEACTPALNEVFTKADKMVRKILVQNVVQEFGDTTRKEVKSEVAGLGKVVLSGLM
ncbi:hypothetical protein AAFC00_002680 [Neodothiora populina]|uniref:Uncharacterized protein n=1 Tax=Neodothiora populina TaxID=2781224 RepID=A0ABR3P818_9PEZI